MIKKFLGIMVLGMLISSNAYAETFFLKCPEKISKIREDNTNFMKEGQILGIIYVKLDESKSKVTLHYIYESSEDKPFVIFKNKKTKKDALGFSITIDDSGGKIKVKDSFMFVKVGNTYALTRSSYWWSPKTKEYEEMHSDYDSTSKCTVLNKKEYKKLLK